MRPRRLTSPIYSHPVSGTANGKRCIIYTAAIFLFLFFFLFIQMHRVDAAEVKCIPLNTQKQARASEWAIVLFKFTVSMTISPPTPTRPAPGNTPHCLSSALLSSRKDIPSLRGAAPSPLQPMMLGCHQPQGLTGHTISTWPKLGQSEACPGISAPATRDQLSASGL